MTTSIRYTCQAVRVGSLAMDFLLFCVTLLPATRVVRGVWLMSANDHRWVHGRVVLNPLCAVFLVIMVFFFVYLEGLVGPRWASGYWGFASCGRIVASLAWQRSWDGVSSDW